MDETRLQSMIDTPPVTVDEFEALRNSLGPDDSQSWRQIPWHVSLVEAVRAAAREQKPIAMVVRSGHPLGCTCNNGLVDRASIIGNDRVAELLLTRFVPVAVDQHIHRRLDGEERELFERLVKDAGQLLEISAQGFYVFNSAADILGFRHTQETHVVEQMLVSALKKIESMPAAEGYVGREDGAGFAFEIPHGTTVLDVVSKVLGGYGQPMDNRENVLQTSLGRDHCWIRPDEVADLAEGIVPGSLLTRIARFHLIDNTRGEAPMWTADDVRFACASLNDGLLTGSVLLDAELDNRGFEASLFGVVKVDENTVHEFDVIARGTAWGEGEHNAGAPRGKYPLAVRFTLAKGALPFDAIPPGAARTRIDEYLGMPVTADT